MNPVIERRFGFGRQTDMLILALSWFAFGSLFQTVQTPRGIFIVWVLATTLLLILSLEAIGYFERYTPQPELSGVLGLLLSLPVSAVFARWLIARAAKAPLIPYHEVLRASIWVALVFEFSQWAIFKLNHHLEKRWVLATCLLPDELAALRAQVEDSHQREWVAIKPMNNEDSRAVELEGNETLVISRAAVHELQHYPQFLEAHLRGQRIIDARDLLKELRSRLDLRTADAWSFFLGSRYQGRLTRFYFHLKTLLEPILALILLALISPVLIMVALAIYFSSGSPILYRQTRSGYRGEQFPLFKFRTMSMTAETSGPQWASKDDPRVTPLGRFLRKTRLDELPQLLNVVRGEISFVGPRPERPEFYRMLNEKVPLFSLRLLVRPGITGWAQVMQGYAATIEECKTKLEYDLFYVQNMSPRLDLRTLVNTLALMIRGNGGR